MNHKTQGDIIYRIVHTGVWKVGCRETEYFSTERSYQSRLKALEELGVQIVSSGPRLVQEIDCKLTERTTDWWTEFSEREETQ